MITTGTFRIKDYYTERERYLIVHFFENTKKYYSILFKRLDNVDILRTTFFQLQFEHILSLQREFSDDSTDPSIPRNMGRSGSVKPPLPPRAPIRRTATLGTAGGRGRRGSTVATDSGLNRDGRSLRRGLSRRSTIR